jgi:hypothetical protein
VEVVVAVVLLLLIAVGVAIAAHRRLEIPYRPLSRSWDSGGEDDTPDTGVREPRRPIPGSGSAGTTLS